MTIKLRSMVGLLCVAAMSIGLAACASEVEEQDLFEEDVGTVQQEYILPPCSQSIANFNNNCARFGGTQSTCATSEGSLHCYCTGGWAEGGYSTTCSGGVD